MPAKNTLPDAITPQFRTLLLRKLKNVFPTCTATIERSHGGHAFQLFDTEGRPRSGLVNVYGGQTPLTKATLIRAVRFSGEPEAGFPPEMIAGS